MRGGGSKTVAFIRRSVQTREEAKDPLFNGWSSLQILQTLVEISDTLPLYLCHVFHRWRAQRLRQTKRLCCMQ